MSRWVFVALLLLITVVLIGVIWAALRAVDRTKKEREQR
jgi:cbb3-type cytochrome oxidase subunit 3